MPPVQDITTRKKKWWYYLPYLPVLCFISEVIGVAIWDVNTRAAVKAIRNCLQILGLQVDTALVWSSEALAFTVALIILFGLCMLALGAGRSVIAYQADRTGATRMGGRLIAWMWLDAIFIVLWFLLTLWLLLLLLGECLWMAASWGLNTAIQVGAGSARANAAVGNNLTIPHANATAGDCFMACVDLYEFEWALSNNTCFCTLNAVEPADAAMQEALGKMAGSVTGAVLLLISGMWVLMAAASEFGVTRRERQLLRRIAKARMASNIEVAKLLPNGGGGSGIVGFGSKKNKRNKSASALGQPGPAMLVDPETGEVLDVENTPDPRPAPASSSNTSLPDGLKRSGSLAKGARALGKGLAKGGKIFDMMGSFISPGRR